MRRIVVRRALRVGALASAAAGTVAFAVEDSRALVLDIWLLAIAAVLLLAIFRIAHLLAPKRASSLDDALRRMRPEPARAPELSLERDVELSRADALHFHIRLRPVLSEIAAHRVRSRYGIELDREPARARELVPAAAWEMVDPDRPPPEDRLARGPSVESLSVVVDQLETI
jgi:hypothetical protein